MDKQLTVLSGPSKTYYAENLGCGAVEVDLRTGLEALDAAGYQRCNDPGVADVIVVQTCSFLASQAAVSLERTRSLLKAARPDARVLAQGCAVDTERPVYEGLRDSDSRLGIAGAGADEPAAAGVDGGSVRAYERSHPSVAVRVSRGCASGCSFCSIRLSQGRVKSRSFAEIVDAIETASPNEDRGLIHLVSEDVGSYGLDISSTLPGLLESLSKRFPSSIFRLSTISPVWFCRYQTALLRLLTAGTVDRVLYCPAQSGSTRVLRAMRRGYTAKVVRDVYDTLFTRVPSVRLYTDFIVGHPGETARDFRATLELATAYPFEAVSVWAYEERAGTRSAKLDGTVPSSVRVARAKRVAAAFVQAHWRRHNLSVSEGVDRLLRGRLPVRSNVRLFEVEQSFAFSHGDA